MSRDPLLTQRPRLQPQRLLDDAVQYLHLVQARRRPPALRHSRLDFVAQRADQLGLSADIQNRLFEELCGRVQAGHGKAELHGNGIVRLPAGPLLQPRQSVFVAVRLAPLR